MHKRVSPDGTITLHLDHPTEGAPRSRLADPRQYSTLTPLIDPITLHSPIEPRHFLRDAQTGARITLFVCSWSTSSFSRSSISPGALLLGYAQNLDGTEQFLVGFTEAMIDLPLIEEFQDGHFTPLPARFFTVDPTSDLWDIPFRPQRGRAPRPPWTINPFIAYFVSYMLLPFALLALVAFFSLR